MEDDTARLERLRTAAKFYTGTLNLAVIQVHYPLYSPEYKPGDPEGTLRGRCSCHEDYVVRDDVIDKELSKDSNAGKHPVKRGWASDESKQIRSPEDVDLAWGVPWNIGVPVGENFGLAIIDVDTRNGGFKTVNKLAEQGYTFPKTFKDFSSGSNGSRGYHLFYRVTDPAIWNLLKEIKIPGNFGLDLKGIKDDRGQVVVAPSMHATGIHYELDHDGPYEIHELTEAEASAMLEAFEAIRPVKADGTPVALGQAGPMEQVKLWLAEGRVSEEWGPGNHDANMVSAIGSLIHMVPPAEDVHAAWIDRIQRDPTWVPYVYSLMVQDFDAAICRPRPYFETEPAKIMRLIRDTLMREMGKSAGAIAGLRGMSSGRATDHQQRVIARAQRLAAQREAKTGK